MKQLPDKARKELLEEYASYEANCDSKDRETSVYKAIWESVCYRHKLDHNHFEHPRR